MITNIDNNRVYTTEEGQKMAGKMVVCDTKNCDGKKCGHYHDKPHLYDDEECFSECCHAGKTGFCVLVEDGSAQ